MGVAPLTTWPADLAILTGSCENQKYGDYLLETATASLWGISEKQFTFDKF